MRSKDYFVLSLTPTFFRAFLILSIKIGYVEKMKLVTFIADGQHASGYIDGEEIVVCAEGDDAKRAVLDIINEGSSGLDAWRNSNERRIALADVDLISPIPEPLRDVFCVGKNYYAHAAEFFKSGFDSSAKEQVPSHPVIFTKATTSVCGPGDTVLGSLDHTDSVDYEGELGVIIGKRAFQVSKSDALDCVFGYVTINDVTSRKLQKDHNQWVIGKGIDTFCPMGPWISTADEVGDVRELALTTEINGEERQGLRPDFRHSHPDRDDVPDDDASARRHHRHRHTGRRGHRFRAAEISEGGGCDARFHHRPWHARKPRGMTPQVHAFLGRINS